MSEDCIDFESFSRNLDEKLKVRFSDHKPIEFKESQGSCDLSIAPYKTPKQQLAEAENSRQREAWRVYAAAAMNMNAIFHGVKLSSSAFIENVIHIADEMLTEENKRFGGDDENL